MSHDDPFEVFYEEIGAGNEVVDEETYREELSSPEGLNEEDVYKLTQDITEQDVRFEEQIDRKTETEIEEE